MGRDFQQLGHLGVGSGAPSWTSDGAHIFYWGYQTFFSWIPMAGMRGRSIEPTLVFDNDGYGFYGALQPTP